MNRNWALSIKDFTGYLTLEKSLSQNSVEAYTNDVSKLREFIEVSGRNIDPGDVTHDDLKNFLVWYNKVSNNPRSQARTLSGIRAFFRYLLIEGVIETNPVLLIESPKIGLKLPDVLSLAEIDAIVNAIDLSRNDGHRNKAIIETLYGCGLRVSELVNLRITDIHRKEGFVSVIGKGNKQRLVPISDKALKEIDFYTLERKRLKAITDENIMFLNRRGSRLSRVMIFNIIKELAAAAGVRKKVSPHTFRHSFATHMVEAGADLRAVQEMLGHESILTTEIYTHIDRGFLRDTLMLYHPRSGKRG